MKKRPAFDFIVDELLMSRVAESVVVKPMFGSHGVYLDERMYFILKNSPAPDDTDNGIWVATSGVDLPGLLSECSWLKPLKFFENMGMKAFLDWRVLSCGESDFEEKANKLMAMVVARDERIGKITVKKNRKKKMSASQPQTKKKAKATKRKG